MNTNVAFELVELAVSLARTLATGNAEQDATLAGTLLQIIEKSVQAYQDHTGETLDPSLIKAEDPGPA